MMGAHHAISGAAAWVAITASAPGLTTGLYPLTAVGVFTGAVVCAGAALLPDADHPSATIAQSVPGVGSAVTGAIGQLAGGHRKGLHSLLATLVILLVSVALGFVHIETEWFGELALGAGIATMALIAFAARALKLTRQDSWLFPWVFGAAAALLILLFAPTEVAWLPLAVTVGFVVHLLGDALTVGGVPFLWPWRPRPPLWWNDVPVLNAIWKKNGYFALPVLGKTGSVLEWALAVALTGYVLYALVYEGFWAFGLDLGRML